MVKLKVNKEDMRLYVVTTRDFLNDKSLEEECEEILQSGATFLQLREKNMEFEDYLSLAKKLKVIANKYNIPFVIDDNVDVAVKSGADGVHVGQKDMEAARARRIIGNDKILGVSVQTVEQAIKAEKDGADYLGVGPVFPTETKPGAATVDLDEVRRIKENVSIPILVIGGIDDRSIYDVVKTNTDGVAVVSYIFGSEDKKESTKKLRMLSDELFG